MKNPPNESNVQTDRNWQRELVIQWAREHETALRDRAQKARIAYRTEPMKRFCGEWAVLLEHQADGCREFAGRLRAEKECEP